MDSQTKEALIAQYRAGSQVLADTIAQVPPDRLDVTEQAGEWTARQIVHHVADSETTSYIRLRRLLAEDQPVIQGYDEMEFARKLHYDRPLANALEVIRAVRNASAELLASLSEEEWQRTGTHSESGRYTLMNWLQTYATHCHDHAEQIRRAAGI